MTKKIILERKDKVTSAGWRASGSQCLSTTETAKTTDRPLQTDANSSGKALDYSGEVGRPCRRGGRVVSHGAGTSTEHLAPSSAGLSRHWSLLVSGCRTRRHLSSGGLYTEARPQFILSKWTQTRSLFVQPGHQFAPSQASTEFRPNWSWVNVCGQ